MNAELLPLRREKAELEEQIERIKYQVDEDNLKMKVLEGDLDIVRKQNERLQKDLNAMYISGSEGSVEVVNSDGDDGDNDQVHVVDGESSDEVEMCQDTSIEN